MSKVTKYSIKNLEADFPTDEACLAFIFDALHSRTCSCGGEYKQIKGRKQFQCGRCRFQIAPTANTIFHKSDTPLSLWFHAIWVFSNAKSGISAKELERQLGVTYKCAYRILSLIREALKDNGGKLKGDVEIDTGFFGGKGYGGANNEQLGKAMKRKGVVTIASERGGRIRAEVVEDATAYSMMQFLDRNVEKGSRVLTDGSVIYKNIMGDYKREFVNHKVEYSRYDIHVNTVETFFAHLKRSIRGTYKGVSRKHLQAYLDAFVFHYNNRHSDRDRFGVLLGSVLRGAR